MLYCPSCMRLCKDDSCEICHRKKKRLREANASDPVFLTEDDFITAGAIESALDEANIPFMKQSASGAAVNIIVGCTNESYSIYVPYRAYDAASEIATEIKGELLDGENEIDIGDQWMQDGIDGDDIDDIDDIDDVDDADDIDDADGDL